MGVPGVEPGTSSLSGTRSNQLSYTPSPPHPPPTPFGGGGSRVRTGGIQLAKLALYQLSYAPGGRLSRRALKRPLLGRVQRPGRDTEGQDTRASRMCCDARGVSAPAAPKGVPPSPGVAAGLLLRKEVIQPLVPQRLPCYDFIPITTHTLDGSPPRG